jgi:hypothetical protein
VANTNVFSKDTLNTNQEQVEGKLKEEIIVEEYADFYLKQLPTTQAAIDSIGWNAIRPIINLVIYKEKFKEYELATKSWSSCCKTVLKKN